MTETGASKAEKIGDDKSINFRPSPNFKHMRKYLKYKYEEAGCPGASSTSQSADQGKNIQVDNKVNVVVQPPLPPNTPPPDYPPYFVLKKEIMDDGYENINAQPENEAPQEEHESKPVIQIEVEEKPKKKEMCRDFARGNCTWNPCKKSHELDLSQLEGVYDFCKDFANGKCKRPNCRFVHATTFEKESYFRTGYLPPHLRPQIRNKKDAHITQPQPQQMLVATAPVQPMPMPVFPIVSNAPDFRASCAPPLPPVMSIPPAAMDPGMAYNMFVPPQPPPPATSPQPIPDYSEFAILHREVEEPVQKSCTRCRISEIRYQENLQELEKIEDSTQSIKDQITLLDQRKAKLLAILTRVLWKDMPK